MGWHQLVPWRAGELWLTGSQGDLSIFGACFATALTERGSADEEVTARASMHRMREVLCDRLPRRAVVACGAR